MKAKKFLTILSLTATLGGLSFPLTLPVKFPRFIQSAMAQQARRIHDVSFDELGVSLGTPPQKIPLTNLQNYADRKGAIAAFVNGHWNGNTGRYNVILITSGAQRIHDARFDELGVSLGTPPQQIPLTNLQNYADRKGAYAPMVLIINYWWGCPWHF